MKDLSPETRLLLERGADVPEMSALRRARLKRTVLTSAATGAALGATSTAAAAMGSSFAGVVKVFAVCALIGGTTASAGDALFSAAPESKSVDKPPPPSVQRGPAAVANV